MKKQNSQNKVYNSQTLYSVVNSCKNQGLVLYGAGFLGKMACEIFSLFAIRPKCFCDDNTKKQGTTLEFHGEEIPIMSLEKAFNAYPHAVYITTVASDTDRSSGFGTRAVMNARLANRGLLTSESHFYPLRYLALLEGGYEALQHPTENLNFPLESIENIVVFSSMGRSGTVYFDTLMDGHPNILNIGGLGNTNRTNLKKRYKEYLWGLEDEELVIEIVREMMHYFDFNSGRKNSFRNYVTEDGEPDKSIYISAPKFISSLLALLKGKGQVTFSTLIKSIFSAYHNAAGTPYRKGERYWIFYETHNTMCGTDEIEDLLSSKEFKRIEYLVIIREPVQQMHSSLNYIYQPVIAEKGETTRAVLRVADVVYSVAYAAALAAGLEKGSIPADKVVNIIRFEDVKRHTYETMCAVCKWLNIDFEECLLKTTINGNPVFFPNLFSRHTGATLSAGDTTAIDRHNYSQHFTSFDIFRLNLVFQNVQKAYGYACDVPDYRIFSYDFLEELYRYPFKFELWMDETHKMRKEIGYDVPEDWNVHEVMVKTFLDYMKKEQHDLVTNVIRPEN